MRMQPGLYFSERTRLGNRLEQDLGFYGLRNNGSNDRPLAAR